MMQEVAPSPSSSPQWGEGQGEGKGGSGVQPLNILKNQAFRKLKRGNPLIYVKFHLTSLHIPCNILKNLVRGGEKYE